MNSYTVLDLETTGFGKNAEIIEIAAIKIRGNSIVDTFSSLVSPASPIPEDVVHLTGITNQMVASAPNCQHVLSDFLDFLEDDCLIGHNITSFDFPILRRVCNDQLSKHLSNALIDTLYIARKKLDLENYKLVSIANYFGFDADMAHRALHDCYLTNNCYQQLIKLPDINLPKQARPKSKHHSESTQALQTLNGFLIGIIADSELNDAEIIALNNWLLSNKSLAGQYPFDRVFYVVSQVLEDGVIEDNEREELLHLFQEFTNPVESNCSSSGFCISGKHCCVTGEFDNLSRLEVQDLVSNNGGIFDKNITKKTDFLIVGTNGSEKWSCGNYGGKVKKALEYNEKGCSITILKEKDFFACLNEN